MRGLSLLLPLLLAGCATHADRLHEVREFYYAGRVDLAAAKIDEHIARGGADRDVLKLDRAVVELAAGRPQDAERTLHEIRDQFDYLQQKSLVEGTASMLVDDNQAAYAGEDYERVLVRVFLALANLMHDGGDAQAYALQAGDLQEQIIAAGGGELEENPKLAYKRFALGPYLYGALREETHVNYDDAARAYSRVCSWEPDFPFGKVDLDRAAYGRHSRQGCGVLYVFALVGRGPCKIEVEELPSSVSLLIADRVLSHNARHTVAPTVAPIKVPKVVVLPNDVRGVLVSVDGKECGGTATIADIGQLAVQQYEAIYPQVLARAVARRAVKKAVFYGAKEAMSVENGGLANLGMDVAGVIWEATESADTRCWGLLPDRIQVLRLELPVGEHRIGFRAAGRFGPMGQTDSADVRIEDGRNTYVLVNYPTDRLVGKVLVGRQP